MARKVGAVVPLFSEGEAEFPSNTVAGAEAYLRIELVS